MILTYEKIREVKLNEKGERLQKLPPNFFENAFNYIKLKKGTPEEESARSLVFSIFELRLKKISNLAFLFYKSNKIPENLEKEEEELYLNLVQILRNFREKFETRKIEIEKVSNFETTKKVKFLVDTPEIFLPCLGTCRFKKGEEREFETKVADFLLNKGFCKLV